jgi:zinc transport system substrate-binding protein
MQRVAFSLAVLAVCAWSAGVARAAEAPRLDVFVSIAPQAYVAERVGGDRVTVYTFVGQGQDPHTFEPSPRQVVAIGRADVFFTVGLPFEARLMAKVREAKPNLAVVDMTEGIARRAMEGESHVHGEGAAEEAHGRGEAGEGLDPHVWLSAPRLAAQAANVAAALGRVDPGHAREYAARAEALAVEMRALHAELQRTLAPYKGRAFLVFHPAFGYFADDYGLRQEAVEAGGRSPTPRQLADLIKRARAANTRVVFVHPQFDPKSAEAVAAALGGVTAPLDPLAADGPANLRRMGAAIRDALERK